MNQSKQQTHMEPLSKEQLSVIRGKVEKDFKLNVGGLIHQKIDELIERQSSIPITLAASELYLFGQSYWETVRGGAARLAAALGQAKGLRGELTAQGHREIEGEVRRFLKTYSSRKAASDLVTLTTSGFFEIANRNEAIRNLAKHLSGFMRTGTGMRSAKKELTYAIAVYGGATPQRLTGGEKIRNPVKYPTMTMAEAREVLLASRSTIYRWLEEGTLERASVGKQPGTRGKVLILTKSVVKFLKKNPN